MNCCPRESASLAPSMRASGSTEPPGGNGTTNFTGFVGQACATTVSGASAQTTIVAAAAARRTTRNMIAPLPGTRQVTIRPMKIAMMGSGGGGGFFGGRLAHAGYDVSFIARGAHLPAMRGRGLGVENEPPGEIRVPNVRATADPATVVLGEYDGRICERARFLHEALLKAGVTAELSNDVRRAVWEKYAFLVGISAPTTAMRTTIGPIRTNPRTRAFLLEIMREVVAVGRAHGIALPADYADACLARADGLPAEMTASMAHDLQRGNRLEVEWLSGGLVQLGTI